MARFVHRIIACAAIALLFSTPAIAAVTANSQITAQTPNRGIVQFLEGTDVAGTYKTLYTGGANGSVCWGISATTNDAAAAHVVTVQVTNGGVNYGGTAINVPVSSGFTTTTTFIPPISIMTNWTGLPIDGNGNPYIYLASASDAIRATFATALTASAVLNMIAVCADF